MPKKILVVDNHPLILELISSFLKKDGHEVRVAQDGLSALDVLEGFVPEIMFIDLVMPNISGDKLCRIVRSMPHLRGVFIVILSAIVSEGEKDFLSYGADACIAKGSFKNIFLHVQELIADFDKRATREWEPRILGLEGICQREITKELLSSQRHLELVLDHMSEGVVRFTREQKIIYVNASAVALFGQPEEKLLKKRLKVYEDILPICSVCKKIRNDKGQEPGNGDWQSIDEYMRKEAGLKLSHGYCPDCYEKFMQEMETFSPGRKE